MVVPKVQPMHVDGSLLYNESKYSGLAARRGWAVATFSRTGELLAAAHGRPPAWVEGIWYRSLGAVDGYASVQL